MQFMSAFDKTLSEVGPPAFFRLSHEEELFVDVMRSRDLYRQNQPPYPLESCHCMVIDLETNWPQYALITSPKLCEVYAQGSIVRYATYALAIEAVAQQKAVFYSQKRTS